MRRFFIACCSLAVVVGGIWFYMWWHGPAETTKLSADRQTAQGVLGSETTLLSWRTAYFTTQYPNFLRVITSNEVTHGNTDGQYVLGSVSLRQTDQLAVTVGSLNGAPLSELSAVKLRERQTDTYQQVTKAFLPDGGMAFSSKETYEIAVFWREDDQYAAVVVSGSSTRSTELEQALQAVITNWVWR